MGDVTRCRFCANELRLEGRNVYTGRLVWTHDDLDLDDDHDGQPKRRAKEAR